MARLYYKDQLVGSAPQRIELQDIKKFYEHRTVGGNAGDTNNWWDPKTSEWALPATSTRTSDSGEFTADSVESKDVIVFVHGWRMKPEERRWYAETAYKRLYWQGFRGRFFAFSWPTQWVNLDGDFFTSVAHALGDQGNFPRSVEIAFHSGKALASLLKELHQTYGAAGGKVSLFAHSMGAFVAGEALRQLAQENVGKIVDTYVPTQSAASADMYKGGTGSYPPEFAGFLGGGQPYFRHIDDVVRKIVNFYNPDDYALHKWEIGNALKVYEPHDWWADQEYKEGLPGFDASYRLRRAALNNGPVDDEWQRRSADGAWSAMSFQGNPYEMFAYLVQDQRPPLGRLKVGPEGGPISTDVNLHDAPFRLGDDHSGQWRSTIMNRRSYWVRLLAEFGHGS